MSNYTKKRYAFFTFMSVFIFIIPWIRINGNHLFLLSFDKKELNLFFTSFSTQELYLMPFVLIFFFLLIFFVTTLGGRIWCGWACPQTIFRVVYRDLIQTKIFGIRQSTANKQKKPQHGIKNLFAIIFFAILVLIGTSNLLWFFVPPEDFFVYLQNPAEHKLLFGIVIGFAAFFIFDTVYLGEKFCIYVCPYARIQSVMFDNDTVQVIYDEKRGGKIYDPVTKAMIANKPENGECIGCEACVRICPTHIDIRKGMQLECINCLECSDACSKVMGKLGKKSLINWTSENAITSGNKINFFRFRTIGYIVVLSVVLGLLLFISTKKEHMLLNINRTTELYNINFDNGNPIIANDYTFMFENTDRKDHKYYFEIDNPDIKIVRPAKEVKFKAGTKRKIIVRLVATKQLVNDERKDTIIPIVIKAFAVDDKENINIERKTIFAYPKNTVIEEAKKKDNGF